MGARPLRQMEIGDLVNWCGRAYYLRGIEPMSVPDRRALLEDAETGERVTAPLGELYEGPPDRDNRSSTEHH